MEYDSILSEPLYKEVEFYAWEKRLFQTSFVKRLKYLAHFGGGAFVSPVVHSRYEHTVGVWKLAALYFPNHDVLRAAAILHDIGHLPFSHAVEKPLDYNHHALTEAYIQDGEIASILHTADLQSGDVVQYLRQPSPLTGTREVLGLDHLDSFLRDTYMSGRMEELPSEVLKRIHCSDRGVETDKQTGLQLLRLIIRDHELFLSPLLLAVDRLLAEAISILWNNGGGSKEAFAKQTDADVIAILKSSQNLKVRAIIHTI
ncbi:HD domain-containing protein [Virgibacillus sp.]|uniref:HD domain-containing protein n=1 Tax=Virgibacillus sp. TaxID=1872700 RepID=UPI0017979E9F|nr:HD domain-containing protein [Virgibacillus sp.]NWO13524.1 HD domain-containing protein [Virgibacillus sp.]